MYLSAESSALHVCKSNRKNKCGTAQQILKLSILCSLEQGRINKRTVEAAAPGGSLSLYRPQLIKKSANLFLFCPLQLNVQFFAIVAFSILTHSDCRKISHDTFTRRKYIMKVGTYSVASESQEKYWLYTDVCVIPANFEPQLKLMNVSRAVCRFACSDIYDRECSGFLYSRRQRCCTLSPYTGELIPTSAPDCNHTMGLEFYRRSRLLGTIFHV